MSTKVKREERPTAIPEHKHCLVCGKAIAMRLQYCSLKCEETERKKKRSEEKVRLIFYLVLTVILLIFFLSSILRL